MPATRPRPVMLVILDGWGWREEVADNAVRQAKTPSFDRLWAEGAGQARMLSVGLHLRIIGRPGRISGLEALLAHMDRPGVWFATRRQIAECWLEAHA